MSTNWNKYSTPEQTLSESKELSQKGVVEFNVGSVRNLNPLEVVHSPIQNNRAHSNIINLPNEAMKKLIIRTKLAQIAHWVIPLKI